MNLRRKRMDILLRFPADAHVAHIHYGKVENRFVSNKCGSVQQKRTGVSYTAYMMYEYPSKEDELHAKLSGVKKCSEI